MHGHEIAMNKRAKNLVDFEILLSKSAISPCYKLVKLITIKKAFIHNIKDVRVPIDDKS